MNATNPLPFPFGDDIVIQSLKRRYFDIVGKENYPKTPQITKEADNIETAILQLQQVKPV